jgi:hypothetical protein
MTATVNAVARTAPVPSIRRLVAVRADGTGRCRKAATATRAAIPTGMLR